MDFLYFLMISAITTFGLEMSEKAVFEAYATVGIRPDKSSNISITSPEIPRGASVKGTLESYSQDWANSIVGYGNRIYLSERSWFEEEVSTNLQRSLITYSYSLGEYSTKSTFTYNEAAALKFRLGYRFGGDPESLESHPIAKRKRGELYAASLKPEQPEEEFGSVITETVVVDDEGSSFLDSITSFFSGTGYYINRFLGNISVEPFITYGFYSIAYENGGNEIAAISYDLSENLGFGIEVGYPKQNWAVVFEKISYKFKANATLGQSLDVKVDMNYWSLGVKYRFFSSSERLNLVWPSTKLGVLSQDEVWSAQPNDGLSDVSREIDRLQTQRSKQAKEDLLNNGQSGSATNLDSMSSGQDDIFDNDL